MATEFLKCIICPKLPTFSDSSHLLTHIGSKGHLAHLHRLQVKSHQESEAAQKILIYNQWFVEHDIAQLLSERMLQKEAKRAEKQVANQRRTSNVKVENKKSSRKSSAPNQPPAPTIDKQDQSLLVLKTSPSELSDIDFTPVRPSRESFYPTLLSSPPKDVSSPAVEDIEDNNHIAGASPENKAANGSPQLKGIKWPGMGLFDAATAELQRKRNQKKDASVLKRLEVLSGKVDPHETVHSASGVVLKRRHMDNLENDSPVEGEVSVEPPTPKRRRASRSKSLRTSKMNKEKRRPGRPRRHPSSPLPDRENLVTPSTEETAKKMSRFSPTEEENLEFKLAIRNGPRKKKGHFLVFEDSSPSFGVDGSSEPGPATYIDASTFGGQLTYPSGQWSQLHGDLTNPFKLVRPRLPVRPVFEDINRGKENINPFHGQNQDTEGSQFTNPLFLQTDHEQRDAFNPLARHIRHNLTVASQFDPFEDDDVYMPVRNPLIIPFDHINKSDHRDSFGHPTSPVFTHYHRQPLFAP